MSKRVYAGNIPYNTTEAMLRDHFGAVGSVVGVSIVTDRDTNRPRGFAFVEMADAGADAAIAQLDGTDFGGRRLVVSAAKERPQRAGGSGRNGHGDRRDARREDW